VNEVRVDVGGLGVGIIDGLAAHSARPYIIEPVASGAESPDKRTHINNRAYQLDRLSKLMGEGIIDIDPLDGELLKQFGNITYEFQGANAAMKIESKEDARKRGVKSPDAADSVWMGVADLTHLGQGTHALALASNSELELMRDSYGFKDAFTY
jgi:hypothetical protein